MSEAVDILQAHWDRLQRAFFLPDDEPEFEDRAAFRRHVESDPVWRRTFEFLASIDPDRVQLALPSRADKE